MDYGTKMPELNKPRVASLFSGCGGLDIGFRDCGFDLVFACDNDPAAIECFRSNVDQNAFVLDVETSDFRVALQSLQNVDVVLGGFPCQGFSKAGPKRESDDRNTLYRHMKWAIETLQPQVFIAENVDGISQNFKGQFIAQIESEFAQAGYAVKSRILDASAFGVPQFRRRMIFVGIKRDSSAEFNWPLATHVSTGRNGEFKIETSEPLLWDLGASQPLLRQRTIEDAISDLVSLDVQVPDHRVTGKWPANHAYIFKAIKEGQKLCNVRFADTSIKTWEIPEVFGDVSERQVRIINTIAQHRRHKKYGDIPNGNPLPVDEICRLSGLKRIDQDIAELLNAGYLKKKNGGYDVKGATFCSGMFKRPNWDEPSPTVLTNFHNPRYFLHPTEDRPFSLRECARLQGFRDDFIFVRNDSSYSLEDGYRLVGNAVPPPLAAALATSVAALWNSKKCIQV